MILKFKAFRDRFVVGDGPPLLLLACTAALLFSPFLLGGQILASDEQLGAHYQHSIFYSEAIARGESFLWNPYSYTGFPTYVDGYGAFLSPITYLTFKILPVFIAWYLLITLCVFAGLVFAYLLGRAFSLSRTASLLVAFVYCVSQLSLITPTLSTAHTFFVFPLIIFALYKAKCAVGRGEFFVYIALGGFGMGVGFVAGYLQLFIYELALTGCFALYFDWRTRALGLITALRALPALALMFGIGFVLGAPVTIPLLAYSPFTLRTARYAAELAAGHAIQIQHLFLFVLPQSISLPAVSASLPLYFGIVGLFFALSAVFFLRTPIILFLALLYTLLFALAANLPIVNWLSHIPPFNRISSIDRWLIPGALLPALLAGYGFEHRSLLREHPRFKRFMRVFTWLAALCVALLLAAYFVFEIIIRSTVLKQQLLEYIFRAYGRTLESFPHPMSYYLASLDRVLSSVQHTVSLSNPQFWTFVLPVTLGLLVIHFCIRFPYTTLPKVFLVIVMFLTLGMNYWGQNLPSLIPSSSYFDDTPPAARLMRKRSKGFDQNRFVLVGGELLGRSLSGRAGEPPTPQESILAVRDLLMNETGTAYGLAALDGYEPLRSLRQNLLITTVFATHLNRAVDLVAVKNGAPLDEDQNQNSAIYKKITPEEKAVDVVEKLPLLSMMNVKYLISLYPLKSPELTLLAPLHIERPYLDYYVYENRSVMPRLYFANNPLFFTGTERALFIALLETKDFTKKTFIECAECVPSPLGKGVAHAVRTENGLLVASTTSTTGGWLVYSETSLPGWIAQVDGARVPIHTANFLFQAIFVPKGEHIIEFRYVGSFALFLEKYGIRKL